MAWPTGIRFLVWLQVKQGKLIFKKMNAKKASKLTGWITIIIPGSFMGFTLKIHKNLSKECSETD